MTEVVVQKKPRKTKAKTDITKRIDGHIGDFLKKARRDVGMTQEALGALCGASYQQIQNHERCITSFTCSRLLLLSAGLNIPVKDFFAGMLNEDGVFIGDETFKALNKSVINDDIDFALVMCKFKKLSPRRKEALLLVADALIAQQPKFCIKEIQIEVDTSEEVSDDRVEGSSS